MCFSIGELPAASVPFLATLIMRPASSADGRTTIKTRTTSMALAAVFILFFSMDENGMDLVWME
jgi:hypothetical protein